MSSVIKCLWFFRSFEFITIAEKHVESLAEDLEEFPSHYLSSVVFQTLQHPVFASNFAEVRKKCVNHQCVSLRGPKGCGKSFILAATFAVL